MMKATPESPRMFESDLFDLFSRIPAWVIPTIYVPIIGALLWTPLAVLGVPWAHALVQFAVGFVVWTLTEYWLHRTLFHWIPDTSWGERFHFFIHGVHHDYPKDKYRLVMPPMASLALGLVFFAFYWGVAQLLAPVLAAAWVYAFYAGKVAGYLNYDMTHYYIHHFRPKTKWGTRLRAHHMNHHHNRPDAKFGVSFMFWDRVFGTR